MQKALKNFDKALEIAPEYHRAWNGKGNTLRELGRPKEGLEAINKALECNPDNALAWYNKGCALHEIDRPSEARVAFLRALRIWRRASHTPKSKTNPIPSILSHFQEAESAPLLLVSLIERHELLDVCLREPSSFRQAYRRTAPYRLLKHYFEPTPENESKKRKYKLLGLSAFYLGNPFLAEKWFGRVDTVYEDDLCGAFYYARIHQEYARGEDANIIIDVSQERAEQILQRAEQWTKLHPRQLYYAGQLFASGADPGLSKASQCFEAAADVGFLPAMYMQVWVIRKLKGLGDLFDSKVKAVLEEEKNREPGERKDKDDAGFLRGELPEFSDSSEEELLDSEKISAQDASEAVDAIEQVLWHRAHRAEIIDAIRDVNDWLVKKETEGELGKYESLVSTHEPSAELDEWIANRQNVSILRQRLEQQSRSLDLEALRERLNARTHVPSSWLENVQTSSEELERWLGHRIYEDEEGSHLQSHQELIIYLALKGKISSRAALALSAYLLVTSSKNAGRFNTEDFAQVLVGGLLGTGGSELLQAIGVRVALLGGVSLDVGSSLTGAFLARRVLESAGERPEYPDFRTEFDMALEGQPDDTYRMIQEALARIDSHDASREL